MLTQMIPLQTVQCVYHQDDESHRVLALAAMTAQQYALEGRGRRGVQVLATEDSHFLGVVLRSLAVQGLDPLMLRKMEKRLGWVLIHDDRGGLRAG